MSFFNMQDIYNSSDEQFLQNLGGSLDVFQQFCKIQTHSDRDINKEAARQIQEQNPSNLISNSQAGDKDKCLTKEKKKQYYRDKLAKIMKPEEFIKKEYSQTVFSSMEQNKTNSKQQQLKRNRESAKNTRKLKKQYIAHLQKKNQEQAKVITELSFKIQQVTLQRDRLKEGNHIQFKNFCINKARAYQNLENALKEPEIAQYDFQLVLKEVIEKFGAAGSERMKLINYYMNEIIQDLVSDVHKYFLVSSSFIHNLRPIGDFQKIDLDVMRLLHLDLSKLSSILTKFKDRFIKQTTVFKDLTQELYRIFKSTLTQGKVIELVFTQLKRQLESKALAQLIIWFQENRFCREIKRVRDEWVEQLKTGEEVIEVFRKHIKQDNN